MGKTLQQLKHFRPVLYCIVLKLVIVAEMATVLAKLELADNLN